MLKKHTIKKSSYSSDFFEKNSGSFLKKNRL